MKSLFPRFILLGAILSAITVGPLAAQECSPPAGGMTLWLPFDGDSADISSGQVGTVIGSPIYESAKVGQGLAFDGSDDALRLAPSAAVDIGSGSGLTIEMWLKPQDATSPMALTEWSGEDGSQLGLHFFTSTLGAGTLFANLTDINGVAHHIVSPPGVLSQGEFQHVALTYDKVTGVAKIFRNGVELVQANFENLRMETRAGLWIGKRVVGTTAHYLFAGIMDEVSLYSRALTEVELRAVFESGEWGKCKDPVPPSIFAEPASKTVEAGETVVFAVGVGGTSPFMYQWRFNGEDLSGATQSTLILSNVTINHAGNYSVRVENAHGFAVSDEAVLTVSSNRSLIVPPPLANVDGGGSTSTLSSRLRLQEIYRAGMFSNGPIVIRELRFRPSAVLGGVFSTRIPDLQLNLSTTTAQPDALSSTFASNIGANDTMVFRGPLDVSSAFAGPSAGPKAFDILIPLTTPFVYDPAAGNLLLDWRNYEGAPVPINTDGSALGSDGASRLIAFSATATTATAADTGADVLRISYTTETIPPSFISQPSSRTVEVGETASFAAVVGGTPPFVYQWRFNGDDLSGAGDSSLMLSNVQLSNAGEYSVVVQNDAGAVTSLVATLTVNLPPPCEPPPLGLAGWWPFDQNGADLAGGGGAVLGGDPEFIAGRVGGALQFDGVNDAAAVPANQQLNIGNSDNGFTIEGWIKPVNVGQQALVEWNNRAGLVGVHFWLGQGAPAGGGSGSLFGNLVDVNGVSHWIKTAGGLVTVGSWQHVALTYTKSNGMAHIYLNGVLVGEQNLGSFSARTAPPYDLLFGHRVAAGGVVQFRYKGGMDEMSVYARSLAASEIASIISAGSSGKCDDGFPPQIVSGPRNQTALRGGSVAFNVVASGTAPLSYQWYYNENAIEGATASTLSLSDIQFSQGGNYSVTVSNELGVATSENALLTVVYPPATVRVVSANGAGAAQVSVPVELLANGNENALGFSLNFNPAVLAYVEASLGLGVPSGVALLVNTNEAAAGRIGLVVGLPADEVFAEGTQQVALVTFLVAPILNQTTESITFGDQPTLRQLSDVSAQVLAAVFEDGTVAIADSQFEGDVAPRPAGDRSLATIDWVQMGRYVARLDAISSPNEFQRADCAPLATKGNGKLSASDWVQAGRFAVGLDPLTVLGGPTEADEGGGGAFAAAGASGRQLCLANANIAQGQTNVVPVTLECQGNENAASFSITFDPAVLSFVSATPGAGASGGLLNLNTSEVAQGRLGVALAAQPGRTFASGIHELLQVRFAALVPPPATTDLGFGNLPVPREVSDVAANTLATDFTAGTVTVTLPPGPPLRVTRSGDSLFITWPSSAAGFVLEGTEGALGTPWSVVPGVVELGEQKLAVVNIGGRERYFRLKKP